MAMFEPLAGLGGRRRQISDPADGPGSPSENVRSRCLQHWSSIGAQWSTAPRGHRRSHTPDIDPWRHGPCSPASRIAMSQRCLRLQPRQHPM